MKSTRQARNQGGLRLPSKTVCVLAKAKRLEKALGVNHPLIDLRTKALIGD